MLFEHAALVLSTTSVLCCTAPHKIALTPIALHYIHYTVFTVLHCTALHCTALNCIVLHCIQLHYSAMQCNTNQSSALHCITLNCNTKHFTTLHCTSSPIHQMSAHIACITYRCTTHSALLITTSLQCCTLLTTTSKHSKLHYFTSLNSTLLCCTFL